MVWYKNSKILVRLTVAFIAALGPLGAAWISHGSDARTASTASERSAAVAGSGSASVQNCGWSIFGNNNCNTTPQPETGRNANLENKQAEPQRNEIEVKGSVAGKMESHNLPALKDFFENDWPNLPSYYQETDIKAQKDLNQSYSLKFAWRLNGDYESQARFLAIYLEPTVSTQEAAILCSFVATHYQWFLSSADTAIDLVFKKPAESASTHFKDMVFSKRVFIYYENIDFSGVQKGEIEALFQKYGLSVIFRSSDYAWEHRNENMIRRNSPLVPNGVSIPDAKLVPGMHIFIKNLSQSKGLPENDWLGN